MSVEKTGPSTVKVTAGPLAAVEAYNGVKFGNDRANVSLGRQDNLASAQMKTAEFDLSTAEGKAAYDHFLVTGSVPTTESKGISGVATVEKMDFTSQAVGNLKLGPLELPFEGAKNGQSLVVTTHPDGSKEVSADVTTEGNVPFNFTRKFDPQGNELVSERRYTYSLDVSDGERQVLNLALSGDKDAPVTQAGKVLLTFDQGQLEAYMKQAQNTVNAGQQTESVDDLVGHKGEFNNDAMKFALALAQNNNSGEEGTVTRMALISDGADGKRSEGHINKIDATVSMV